MTHVSPSHATFWQKLGPGGLSSLIIALGGGLITLGIPLLVFRRRVIQASAPTVRCGADAILVLGRRLERDQPTEVFRRRLEHAAHLWQSGFGPRVIIAGGITGCATRSEAEAGREWLAARGVPWDAILLEDRSQHTLENLFNIREQFRAHGWSTLILVTDPLHLARALACARGLGLDAAGSPAAACPPRRGGPGWWARSFGEAFLLYWYHTGLVYSRLIRSERQLSRVT